MMLHGPWTDLELAGDVFVVQTGNNKGKDGALTGRQVFESLLHRNALRDDFALGGITFERLMHAVEQGLLGKRLLEKIDGAALQRRDGVARIAVAGYEDDRKSDADALESTERAPARPYPACKGR
jgi:citrate lyase alpha subunit